MSTKADATGSRPGATDSNVNGRDTYLYHSMNGGQPQDDLFGQIASLVAQATVEPSDTLTPNKVQALLNLPVGNENPAPQALLEALKMTISLLPGEERRKLDVLLLFAPPGHRVQIQAFLASCPSPTGEGRFHPLTLTELRNRPPKEWLIQQVLGARDLVTIYGPPGSGKTFVVIDLCLQACLGQIWAGRFDVTRQLTVAYCAGEGLGGLPQRFAAAAAWHGAEDLPNFFFFEITPQLFADIDGDSIGQFIAEWAALETAGKVSKLDILVIDTLHSATVGAEENSAQDMGKVLRSAKLATKVLGCAVILVHHTNKAGTGERGSSALRGAMDTMLEVKPTSDKFTLECAKLKDDAAWKPQTFALVEQDNSACVQWDAPSESGPSAGQKATDKEALLAELRRYPSQQFTAKQLAQVLAKSDNYTRTLLKELERAGDIKRALSNPGKDASSRNPWVYSLKGTH